MHFGPGPVAAHYEHQNIIVHFHGVVAGEGRGVLYECGREALDDVLKAEKLKLDLRMAESESKTHPRLVIHDQHPLPVQAQLHLLRPDARRLLQLQQFAHAIVRVRDARLLVHGERGQVLEQIEWFVVQQVAATLHVVVLVQVEGGPGRLAPLIARIRAVRRIVGHRFVVRHFLHTKFSKKFKSFSSPRLSLVRFFVLFLQSN